MFPCRVFCIKKATPIFIITMSSLCAFFISEYATQLQIESSCITNISLGYKILFKISISFAASVPITIFGFLYFTTHTMANEVFDLKISSKDLLFVLGIAFVPMMLYYYFYWFNLLFFCRPNQFSCVDDFTKTKFVFGLTHNDFKFINQICWLSIYFIIILYFIYKDKPFIQSVFTVILPSAILLLTYHFLF